MRCASLLLALLALAACDRGPQRADKAGVAGPGGAVRRGGALPQLRGIPDYPRADTEGSVQMVAGAPGGAQGALFGFRTPDSPERVVAFYAAAAGRAGFTVSQRTSIGPLATLSAADPRGEGFHVAATRAGDVTQVQIIAGAGGP